MARKVSFLTSVDDWLDEKKKTEGAEGLWRIHDKLYDFTIWSRTHPGGKFWIDVTRGTDITEVFESHHLTNEAESLLQKYYRREAITPRNSVTNFNENGFYKTFKRKVSEQELTEIDKHNLGVQVISDCLAGAVFLTGLLGIRFGNFWTLSSGVFLGLLSISSHSFFHSKENWRVHYFDLSLMSSRDWKIRHVLSHHQYRDTIADLEIAVWELCSQYHKYIQLAVTFVMYFVAAHLQFIQRCLNVFLSKKLGFNIEELVGFSLPLFLFFFGGANAWETFKAWNLIIMIGSFCFCIFSSGFYSCSTQTNFKTQREKEDFGIVQLSLAGNNYKQSILALSYLNSYRGNPLHYLCPRVSCESVHEFIPVLEEALQELGIVLTNKSPGFLEEFEGKMPEGHVFFS